MIIEDLYRTGSTEVKFPRIQWRPYLATAPSRTPIIHYSSRRHPLLISLDDKEESVTAVAVTHHTDYPFGKLFEHRKAVSLIIKIFFVILSSNFCVVVQFCL